MRNNSMRNSRRGQRVLLTLLLVPAYFSIAISIESRIGRLFHKFIGQDAHRMPSGPAPQTAAE